MSAVRLPDGLRALTPPDPSWGPWLDALPGRTAALLAEWQLTQDGPARHGRCALVLPVRTPEAEPAALTLTWPHREAEHEHLALQHWHGDGAVRLIRADPHRWALLLERAGTRDLSSVDDVAACGIVGDLLARIHRPAPPQLRRLSEVLRGWTDRLAALPRSAPLPHRLVTQAVGLGRELAADPLTDGTCLHTDAHYANVLAGEREPWLLIDPKPLSGDPHYEPTPLLTNRWAEAVAGGVRPTLRARLAAVVDALGLDPDRARDWVVVRSMCEALWALEHPGPTDLAVVTRAVTVAKAVQD